MLRSDEVMIGWPGDEGIRNVLVLKENDSLIGCFFFNFLICLMTSMHVVYILW